MFTTTGNNLNILICAEYNLHHDWMAFFSWYTIHNFLPEATVAISCVRSNVNQSLFNWTVKCKTKCFMHKNKGFAQSIQTAIKNDLIKTPVIAIPCSTFMIKELTHECIQSLTKPLYDGSVWFFPDNNIKQNAEITEFNSFTNYNALAKFDITKWCETKKSHPFGLYWKYLYEEMPHNEAKILNLWKKVKPLYENFAFTTLT